MESLAKNHDAHLENLLRFYSAYDLRQQRVGFAVARHVGVPEEKAQVRTGSARKEKHISKANLTEAGTSICKQIPATTAGILNWFWQEHMMVWGIDVDAPIRLATYDAPAPFWHMDWIHFEDFSGT